MILGVYMSYIRVILGYIGVKTGLYWDHGNKMEITV